MTATTIEMVATVIFAIAIIHTFTTFYFERLAHRQPNHAGLWHLLGEVEAVFGEVLPALGLVPRHHLM